ncbi:MAG: hypothetical protein JXA60_06805 [Candidatus Coatesbacteria bacterium]|nr:hypothetical protein [Candidatus Coatesbacteria bacterium]
MPLFSFVLYNWKKYLDLVKEYHNLMGMNQTDFALMIDIPPQRYSAWRHQKIKPQKKSVEKVHKGIFKLLEKGLSENRIDADNFQIAKSKLDYLRACINLMDLDVLLNLSDNLFQSLVELPEFVYNVEGIPRISAPQASYQSSPSLLRLPLYNRIDEFLSVKYPWEHNRHCVVDKTWLPLVRESSEYFALYLSDSSLSDRIIPGDLAIFEATDNLEEGEIGLFYLDDKDSTIRILRRIKTKVVLTSLPRSKDTIPLVEKLNFEEFKILGRLVAFIGKPPLK